MSNNDSSWIWSEHHGDHYRVTYDRYSRPIYHWYSQTQTAGEPSVSCHPVTPTRQDSGHESAAQMPDPAPYQVRIQPGFIPGTPSTGWYDLLDSSYRMRTGAEAYGFFVVGRVFAMLYTETASETAMPYPNDDAYTVVRFGESAHTNIRRFVVVEVKRGFVYACGIGTYSGRGTFKEGCRPSEHTIVYFTGTHPASCYIPGEYENGMDKEPLQVEPVDGAMQMRPESRIRFGKTYPIEMNVKVKDIGRVHPGQLSTLLQYWNDER